MKIFLIFIAICAFGYYAYNADALYGQYLFKQLCENEGGARFYKRVEKGQGWLVESTYKSRDMKHLNLPADSNRGFIRFKAESGIQFDARLKTIPPYGTPRELIDSPEYTLIEPANLAISPRYVQRSVREVFNPDPRFLKRQSFGKQQTQVIDLQSNEVVATQTSFGYTWTTPDRVILNAPTAITCHIHTSAAENFSTDIYQKSETK